MLSPASQLRWKSVYFGPLKFFCFQIGSGIRPACSPGMSMPVGSPRPNERASACSGNTRSLVSCLLQSLSATW